MFKNLRPSKNPQQHPCLAGVVQIIDTEGRGYCHIQFNEAAVTRIGALMPQGLGPEHPAYLKAIQGPRPDQWRVLCIYFGNERGVLLYTGREKPTWISRVFRV